MSSGRILVTGAAGRVGAVGSHIVKLLLAKGASVRAMVHRLDERSEALAKLGAQVVAGDLTSIVDVSKAIEGCSCVYFGMAVSSSYLEATAVMAAVAKKQQQQLTVLVNMSQMTVSEMSLDNMTDSAQQKLHFLSEQILNWSGLPVVHVRPTVFLEHPFFNMMAANTILNAGEIRLPFGAGRTSPIAASDVARVIATILLNPARHIGKSYELTGPKSQGVDAIAVEYTAALGRPVRYMDVPHDEWLKALAAIPLVGNTHHVRQHLIVMAELHKANRYDRYTRSVEEITGQAPMTVQQWVKEHLDNFVRKA